MLEKIKTMWDIEEQYEIVLTNKEFEIVTLYLFELSLV